MCFRSLRIGTSSHDPLQCESQNTLCRPCSIPSIHPAERAPTAAPGLQAWRQQLVALQPLVQIEDAVLLGALELVKALAASRPDLAPTLHASVPHLYTYLAAGGRSSMRLCA